MGGAYRGGSAHPDGGGGRRRGGPLRDARHRLALLRLGLSLSEDLLGDHDQLTRLSPDQNHTCRGRRRGQVRTFTVN